MGISFMVTVAAMLGGLAQKPVEPGGDIPRPRAKLPEPPIRTVTEQVAVNKQVVVVQKKLVPTCVLVCPPGPFRRPYYETRYVLVDEQVAVTTTVYETVTKAIPWGGATVHGYATIANLPPLSGGRIREVHRAVRDAMSRKQMLPPAGTGSAGEERVDYKDNRCQIESGWFPSPRDAGRECQIFAQFWITDDMPTTNVLVVRLDVRERPKGDALTSVKASDETAGAVLADLMASPPFPYKVTK